MSTLRAALSTVTRMPLLRQPHDHAPVAAFGIVGVTLGLLAAVTVLAVGNQLPLLGAIGPVAVLTIFSGALHLEGLAAMADEVAAKRPDGAERAVGPSSTGPAGLAAVVLTVLAQVAALASIAGDAGALTAALAVIAGAGASRAAAGANEWLAGRATGADAAVAVVTVALIAGALAVGSRSLVPAATAVSALLAGGVLALAFARRSHGDGSNTLGAVVELSFAAGLLAAALTSLL